MHPARYLVAPVVLAAGLVSTTGSAAETRAFDQAAFQAAQRQNRPILIWVHAPWCPVCKQQGKTIDKVSANPAYKNLLVFRINYDTQKPLWQSFGATQQSTLIAFHGKRETARIAHDADEAKVTAVLARTLT
jgi:thioredoxin 1